MTSPLSRAAKRFYKSADVASHAGGGFDVQLDGHTIRTPKGQTLTVPTVELAEAIAQEWNAQGPLISPEALPLTRLANSAIDGVMGREAEVARDILKYVETDLIFYRASYPTELAESQALLWDPILDWVRAHYHAPFLTGTGIRPISQPLKSVEAVGDSVSSLNSFKLAALHLLTSLTGSALTSLAHVNGLIDADAAWAAAHVDENWQSHHWGADSEAKERQKRRFADFQSASLFFRLS